MYFVNLAVNVTRCKILGATYFVRCAVGGREPPGVMSLCYADRSLPDLLGRPSLHYDVVAYGFTKY